MLEPNQQTPDNPQSDAKIYGRYKQPEIIVLPTQKMAVVHSVGDPERLMHLVLPALYSSVYHLKRGLRSEGRDFRIGHMRVRWPDAHLMPRCQWHGIWGLPIPADTMSLPQRSPHIAVEIETWEYGMVTQLVHLGPNYEEGPDIERLRSFINEYGYEIAGPFEEEYLAGPAPPVQKTTLRYPVRKPGLVTAPNNDIRSEVDELSQEALEPSPAWVLLTPPL